MPKVFWEVFDSYPTSNIISLPKSVYQCWNILWLLPMLFGVIPTSLLLDALFVMISFVIFIFVLFFFLLTFLHLFSNILSMCRLTFAFLSLISCLLMDRGNYYTSLWISGVKLLVKKGKLYIQVIKCMTLDYYWLWKEQDLLLIFKIMELNLALLQAVGLSSAPKTKLYASSCPVL